MAILNELINRSQKETESPKEYYQAIINLCSLANPDMTEVGKISHLLRGLNSSLREKMILMCPSSANDFLQKINMLHVAAPTKKEGDLNVVELLTKALAIKQNTEPSLLNVDDREMAYVKKELKNLSDKMEQLCNGNGDRYDGRRGTGGNEERSCHYCGIKGHLMKDCKRKNGYRRDNRYQSNDQRGQRGSSPNFGRQGNGRGRW